MTLANNYVSDEQIARLNYKPINKKSVIFAKVGAAGKSCCIKPFLCCLSADTFLFCASIRASRDERQEAIFCCSFGIGVFILIDVNEIID
jgi:hypothetical protein